jgi:hypothetical protein
MGYIFAMPLVSRRRRSSAASELALLYRKYAPLVHSRASRIVGADYRGTGDGTFNQAQETPLSCGNSKFVAGLLDSAGSPVVPSTGTICSDGKILLWEWEQGTAFIESMQDIGALWKYRAGVPAGGLDPRDTGIRAGDLDGGGAADWVYHTGGRLFVRFGHAVRRGETLGHWGMSIPGPNFEGPLKYGLTSMAKGNFGPGQTIAAAWGSRVSLFRWNGKEQTLVDQKEIDVGNGEFIYHLAACDLDLDGDDDLVAKGADFVQLVHVDGSRLVPGARLVQPAGSDSYDGWSTTGAVGRPEIVLGDLDANGTCDVLAMSYSAPDTSHMWLKRGEEYVRRQVDIDVSFCVGKWSGPCVDPGAVKTIDLDQDEDLDLYALSRSHDRLFVWRNDGTGRFRRTEVAFSELAELACSTRAPMFSTVQATQDDDGTTVFWLAGEMLGCETRAVVLDDKGRARPLADGAPARLSGAAANPRELTSGDINGDGYLDFFDDQSTRIAGFTSTPAGMRGPFEILPRGDVPASLIPLGLVDVNGDGLDDLICSSAHQSWKLIAVVNQSQ